MTYRGVNGQWVVWARGFRENVPMSHSIRWLSRGSIIGKVYPLVLRKCKSEALAFSTLSPKGPEGRRGSRST